MLAKWTGEVVGTAHIYGISMGSLAEQAGMSRQMLSVYLHGKKKSPSAEPRIRRALMQLVEKQAPAPPEDEVL